MHHTFETPHPVELYVELGSGHLRTEATSTNDATDGATDGATGRTTVEVTGPRAEDFTVEQSGDQVAVVAPHGRGVFGPTHAHRVTVRVPAGSSVATRTGSAATTLTGELAELRLTSGSGDVEVEQATGPVTVESGSGDVRLHHVGGDLRVKSGSGDVGVGEAHGNTSVSTGSGDVHLGVVRGRVSLKSGSGHLRVERPEADVVLSSASGRQSVDHVVVTDGVVSITSTTASGGLRVGVPRGIPVWTDLQAVSGRVTSGLDSLGPPEPGQGHLEVRATSVSGDIRLEQVSRA